MFSILSLSFLMIGLNIASAHGLFGSGGFGQNGSIEPEKIVERQNQIFNHQAELLGTSVDQVKKYWAEGKNVKEMAEELGISQDDLEAKIKTVRESHLRDRLQVLVDNGVITKEQADSRLQTMQNRIGQRNFGHQQKDGGFMRGFGCQVGGNK